MKKICIITTVSGTLKSFVVPTAEHLYKECGYDVTLICANDEEFAKSLPEYIHYIPVPMKRGVSLTALRSVRTLRKIFKREKFDLVQYSTPNASMYASIAAKKEKVPLRVYAQWGIRYVGLSGMSRKIFKFIEKATCKNSTHIRAQSHKNMQFDIDEGLCNPNKISVIGIGGTIGVELSQCRSFDHKETKRKMMEKYSIPQDAFVYGFVGRINADKGVNELITAFENVKEKQPNAYLVLVGKIDNANPISENLLKCATNDPRIIMTGLVPTDEVYHHMAMFDVLTHPTYREGFGKVLQEAMGMNVPIITTDIPGPSEVIENNVSGILCEVKNSDDLAEKMELLYENKSLRESFIKAGAERVEKYFDRPVMLNNIKEEMNKILSE